MKIIFKSKIIKYNQSSVGFIYLPKEHQNKFDIGQQLKITVKLPNNDIIFFAKLRNHNRKGIYVPASVAKMNNLLNQSGLITLTKVNGFFTKISYDGRIYIPQKYAIGLKLKQNEILLIEGIIDGKSYREFCQVKIRQKDSTTEYFCMFNPKVGKKKGIFSIESILSKNKYSFPNKLKDIIKDFNYAFVNEKNVVMYYGNRVPIIIRTDFDPIKISYYLGCYFADGTKRGNSWGICASTFEQAKYYLKLHKEIIPDNSVISSISFTDIKNQEKSILIKKLVKQWKDKTGIKVEERRVRIIDSNFNYSPKTNPFGSLVFKEHRQLTQIYYNRLLIYLFKKIEITNNQKLALEFILGSLEGDGCVGVNGDLRIYSNLKELEILKKIMQFTSYSFSAPIEGKNKGHIFIGSLELIRNIPFLKDKLFIYYPKRRKLLRERLANTGCAQFLLNGTKTSNMLIGILKQKGILNEKSELTKYGKQVQQSLREFVDQS